MQVRWMVRFIQRKAMFVEVFRSNRTLRTKKKKAVAEYSFSKGIIAALFSGLMSAGMAFGLSSGPDIQNLAMAHGTSATWQGMPVLVLVLLGGFTVNGIWCILLNLKNHTAGDYFKAKTPIIANVIFAGLAGTIWVMQFVCQKTGEPRMGEQAYIGFAAVMASSILFSSILGILMGEWKGTGSRTKAFLALGILVLLGSSAVSAYSGYLKKAPAKEAVLVDEAVAAQSASEATLADKVNSVIDAAKADAEAVKEQAVKDEKAAEETLSQKIDDANQSVQNAANKIAEDLKSATENIKAVSEDVKAVAEKLKESTKETILKVDPAVTNAPAPAAPAPAPAPAVGTDPARK